jgi:hypothetical protein
MGARLEPSQHEGDKVQCFVRRHQGVSSWPAYFRNHARSDSTATELAGSTWFFGLRC